MNGFNLTAIVHELIAVVTNFFYVRLCSLLPDFAPFRAVRREEPENEKKRTQKISGKEIEQAVHVLGDIVPARLLACRARRPRS